VAAVGLYGLLAFRVRHRRGELGLRLALGADGFTLGRAIFSLALRPLAPAVAVGLGVGWLLAPLISVALLGEDPRSPLVFVGVAGVFLAVGFAAALGPAIRPAALEPARVLRGD
jgi:putative ABC transport system permease protein